MTHTHTLKISPNYKAKIRSTSFLFLCT